MLASRRPRSESTAAWVLWFRFVEPTEVHYRPVCLHHPTGPWNKHHWLVHHPLRKWTEERFSQSLAACAKRRRRLDLQQNHFTSSDWSDKSFIAHSLLAPHRHDHAIGGVPSRLLPLYDQLVVAHGGSVGYYAKNISSSNDSSTFAWYISIST